MIAIRFLLASSRCRFVALLSLYAHSPLNEHASEVETLAESLNELKPPSHPSSPKNRRESRGRGLERRARREIESVERELGKDTPATHALNGIVVRAVSTCSEHV